MKCIEDETKECNYDECQDELCLYWMKSKLQ